MSTTLDKIEAIRDAVNSFHDLAAEQGIYVVSAEMLTSDGLPLATVAFDGGTGRYQIEVAQ